MCTVANTTIKPTNQLEIDLTWSSEEVQVVCCFPFLLLSFSRIDGTVPGGSEDIKICSNHFGGAYNFEASVLGESILSWVVQVCLSYRHIVEQCLISWYLGWYVLLCPIWLMEVVTGKLYLNVITCMLLG